MGGVVLNSREFDQGISFQGCRDWREPALRLVREYAQAGGQEIPGSEIESLLSDLEGNYQIKNGVTEQGNVLKSSPHQVLKGFLTSLLELVEAVRLEQLPDHRPRVHIPNDILLLCGPMVFRERELLKVLYLDNQNRLLFSYNAALGNENRVWANLRCILRTALVWEARKMIVVHNHPSGELAPGEEDLAFTKKIGRGCELLGIKLLDHLILGPGEKKYFSFAEKNLL